MVVMLSYMNMKAQLVIIYFQGEKEGNNGNYDNVCNSVSVYNKTLIAKELPSLAHAGKPLVPLLLVLVLVKTVHAQRLFYCDSTLNLVQKRFESVCKEYYDFTENKVDSVIEVDLAHGYGYSVPVQIFAQINKGQRIDGLVYGITSKDTIFTIDFSRPVRCSSKHIKATPRRARVFF